MRLVTLLLAGAVVLLLGLLVAMVPAGNRLGTVIERPNLAQPTVWPPLPSNLGNTHAVAPYRGIWLTHEELVALPMYGPAWEQLLAAANTSPDEPDLADQDDVADVHLLAAALVYARSGNQAYRQQVLEGLEAVIGSEGNERRTGILAVARNTPAYVVAADLVNLPTNPPLDEEFRVWLLRLRDTTFSGSGGQHSLVTCHEKRPNNFGTHCGAARIAIDLYLDDRADLEQAAAVFAGWLGDREAYTGFSYGRLDWQIDEDRPVGVNPAGASKEGVNIDGALPEEMRRGGRFQWPPRETGYPWEALQGAVVQAEFLSRAGYPAWEWEDQALRRAVAFLHRIGWPAEGDDQWQLWLINRAYGTRFPANALATPGKNMGWTNWSHPPAADKP